MQQEDIIIVSGLPRSGTSLMMQLLQAGGIPLVCDGKRAADTFNPRGYFEYEAVKSLATDNSWVEQAQGKALKVLYHLLKSLPETLCYKVIFMQRPLNEVMQSQDRMLAGLGRDDIAPASAELAMTFAQQLDETLNWASEQSYIELWQCDYPQLIEGPTHTLQELARFLKTELSLEALKQTIEPNLYRVQAHT